VTVKSTSARSYTAWWLF